jgi:cellulose synthase (UDP-forming)
VGAPRETVVNETVVRENGAEVPRERETVVREGAREDVPVVPITAAGAPVAVEGAREGSRTFGEYGAPQKTEPRRATPGQNRILAFTWLGVASMCVYTLAMLLAFFAPGYTLGDRIASFFLMFGVLFILMHGLGYANSMIKASYGYSEVKRRIFTPQAAPLVDCLVATFNEPPEVVEETVAAMVALDYPNKRVVILDDSTKEESREAVRAIGLRYNVLVVQRTNRRGYKAGAINDYIKGSNAEYVAVFDADALPVHNFLRDIVPIAEESPKLAFVQTPQHYANTDRSAVAMGASRQQAVFYEYICEGKAASRAAFCCGTNVVFRRAALLDVGGFDENSVTEDFSTSLNLHLKGYDSAYYNQIYVYSMAPETLPAYFTQQSRWAFGSVGAFRKVMGSMLRGGLKMRPGQWWEYFLSSTYYFVGWVNFIFMLLPIIYVFGNIKPLRQDVFTYLAIFVPYLLFTMNMFYQGMEARGYSVRDTLLGQQINFACFPVHMSAAVAGIFGMKRPFGVTPKGGEGGKATWLSLWPQLLMLVLSAAAFVWGTYKYVVGLDRNTAAIIINSLWALYHAFLLSGIFRLNKSLRARPVNERSFAANSAIRNADGTLRDDVRVVNGTPVTTAAGVGYGRGRRGRRWRRLRADALRRHGHPAAAHEDGAARPARGQGRPGADGALAAGAGRGGPDDVLVVAAAANSGQRVRRRPHHGPRLPGAPRADVDAELPQGRQTAGLQRRLDGAEG